ncbi:MAG: hypothetical protein H6907_17020 [Hyphomicrobiales bacterium]|nr:hypothetical protein [Hyphomicrobiales bacterium]MCP5373432.1 hypothetical protein [Hyphomicrobiales bacterium]
MAKKTTTGAHVPHGIGPHDGRELDLMLAGAKPLAMFSDVIPSDFEWPDALFAPHVAAGKLVREEFCTESVDGHYKIRHLYFALPVEAWRIRRAHALSLMHFDEWCDEAADACEQLGRLLGYREEDIQAFLDWTKKLRATQA